MIRFMGSTAGLLLFSALLMMTVDRRIYTSKGWIREKKFARALAWSYGLLCLLIVIGLFIYI